MAEWQEKKTRFIHLIHVIKLQPICSNESREEVVLSCWLVGAAQVCWESDSAADQETFNLSFPPEGWIHARRLSDLPSLPPLLQRVDGRRSLAASAPLARIPCQHWSLFRTGMFAFVMR